MIGSSANDADLDPVLGIPLLVEKVSTYGSCKKAETYPSVTIEDVDVVPGVQVIDSTLTVDLESIYWGRSISFDDRMSREDNLRSSSLMLTDPHQISSLEVSS